MPLSAGTRPGPYEVVAVVGAGGMGEVYRARDTRLGRDVALKVMPEAFAGDPDRRVRFEREARTLAALKHPNIAAIHGFEEADGISALVWNSSIAGAVREGPGPVAASALLWIPRRPHPVSRNLLEAPAWGPSFPQVAELAIGPGPGTAPGLADDVHASDRRAGHQGLSPRRVIAGGAADRDGPGMSGPYRVCLSPCPSRASCSPALAAGPA
jgi:hypothetical protein